MRELKVLTGQTVVVATPDATVRGVLESATRHFVRLTSAQDVGSGNPEPIVGLVLIPVARLSYVQAVV